MINNDERTTKTQKQKEWMAAVEVEEQQTDHHVRQNKTQRKDDHASTYLQHNIFGMDNMEVREERDKKCKKELKRRQRRSQLARGNETFSSCIFARPLAWR